MTVGEPQENYKTGYVSIYRSLKNHWIWTKNKPLTKLEAWITILMECNHSSNKVLIHGELLDCNRGESLNSIKTWADLFKWSIQQVRTFLKLLEKDKMILIKGERKTTRISVCNYDSYQNNQRTNNGQLTRRQRATNEQLTTNNNDNNDNNDNKKKINYKKFYEYELEKSENDKQYLGFVDWLYKDNPNEKPLEYVLSLKDQISYTKFNKYISKFDNNTIKKTILSMEAGGHKYKLKSFNLSLNNWLNRG